MGRGLLPAPSCTLGGGGGGMAALVPGASPYRELDARAGPRRGPHLPGRCRAAPAGRGWLMVSGQWLAGCGAAGSSPRLAPPHSLPRVAAHPRTSCRTVGGAWVRGHKEREEQHFRHFRAGLYKGAGYKVVHLYCCRRTAAPPLSRTKAF